MAFPSFDLAAGPSPAGVPALPRPRQWQSQMIALLRRRLERGSQDVLIHAGPGAGKTLGALLSFQRLQREGKLSHLLVFCHRSSIADQWRTAARGLGIELALWQGEAADLPEGGGLLLTYQGAARQLERVENGLAWVRAAKVLAIADEVHHLGVDPEEPQSTAWGHAFERLSQACVLRLGLSGTPFRADNLAFCAASRVLEWEDGERVERIAADLSVEPRQLIAAGDVRPLEFRFQDGWVDHGRTGESERSALSLEGRESWRARNLRRAIQLGDPSSIALRVLVLARCKLAQLRSGEHPGAGGLVIARDIDHARRIAGLLEEEGDRVFLVHSQDSEAANRLEAFRRGEADWLVSVDMCAEGFDAPRLRVVAYLTTVVTRSRFVQAITRAVRMEAERCAVEAIPRHASFVFAPADPRLIGFARSWSVAEPYLIRPKPGAVADPQAGGAGGSAALPLQALREGVGELIRLKGPQLPPFVARQA
ncbi:DEAD/DEAH box helicase [Synechococcus sp. CS-603]|uniref:DEAD/DEAH box helicase n=1 Tax=Synechococcus sp. CS-603 TaxID=2847981 RepID=UPI00223A6967|nr:DEAD/DEAH box helicase family protein [Synechococcus sp. CS-603]MCT0201763.1 DEAD/DEAH box helicase family protein [Synechococcus sp. CS-603]